MSSARWQPSATFRTPEVNTPLVGVNFTQRSFPVSKRPGWSSPRTMKGESHFREYRRVPGASLTELASSLQGLAPRPPAAVKVVPPGYESDSDEEDAGPHSAPWARPLMTCATKDQLWPRRSDVKRILGPDTYVPGLSRKTIFCARQHRIPKMENKLAGKMEPQKNAAREWRIPPHSTAKVKSMGHMPMPPMNASYKSHSILSKKSNDLTVSNQPPMRPGPPRRYVPRRRYTGTQSSEVARDINKFEGTLTEMQVTSPKELDMHMSHTLATIFHLQKLQASKIMQGLLALPSNFMQTKGKEIYEKIAYGLALNEERFHVFWTEVLESPPDMQDTISLFEVFDRNNNKLVSFSELMESLDVLSVKTPSDLMAFFLRSLSTGGVSFPYVTRFDLEAIFGECVMKFPSTDDALYLEASEQLLQLMEMIKWPQDAKLCVERLKKEASVYPALSGLLIPVVNTRSFSII